MPDAAGPLAPELLAAIEQFNALVEGYENEPDPVVQERAFALLESVDTVHRIGLTRLAAALDELEPERRARMLTDPAVRLLLEMYDLLPPAPPPPPVGFVPLEAIGDVPIPRRVWVPVASLADLAPDGLLSLLLGETRVLLASVRGEVQAYEDSTGANPLPVGLGQREGDVVICPWHGCRYDLATGARLDAEGSALTRLPVRVEQGQVLVELSVAPVGAEVRP